ncbi:TrbC/VirB2 family protein [Cupriavidus sp. NPDC089707]|uniref:TrbC/VirB2 family protein n=1 Tax=Cupriavidus sp. NPDC089707 TaxID=3363963 RepID=UPI003805EC0D
MTSPFTLRTRATARKYAPSILLLIGMMAVATSAAAADDSFLGNLGNFICGIATFINTKYLFVIGLIVIVLGAYAYANAESSLSKFISGACVGVGLAAAAPSILKTLNIVAACTGF